MEGLKGKWPCYNPETWSRLGMDRSFYSSPKWSLCLPPKHLSMAGGHGHAMNSTLFLIFIIYIHHTWYCVAQWYFHINLCYALRTLLHIPYPPFSLPRLALARFVALDNLAFVFMSYLNWCICIKIQEPHARENPGYFSFWDWINVHNIITPSCLPFLKT